MNQRLTLGSGLHVSLGFQLQDLRQHQDTTTNAPMTATIREAEIVRKSKTMIPLLIRGNPEPLTVSSADSRDQAKPKFVGRQLEFTFPDRELNKDARLSAIHRRGP